MDLRSALRAAFNAEDHVLPDKQGFDPQVCQCCDAVRKHPDDPECVCDGLNWYLDQDGRVECEAHRFARAVGGSKKSFGFWRVKK